MIAFVRPAKTDAGVHQAEDAANLKSVYQSCTKQQVAFLSTHLCCSCSYPQNVFSDLCGLYESGCTATATWDCTDVISLNGRLQTDPHPTGGAAQSLACEWTLCGHVGTLYGPCVQSRLCGPY